MAAASMDLYSSLPPRFPSSMPPTYSSLYPASPPWPPPTHSSMSNVSSSSSPPSSSPPSPNPLASSSSLPADLDLASVYPASPFDAVCLKHMRRYLQGYDRVYTRLLMDYGAERQRVNQQHWERVHRSQQQHKRKLDQLSHDTDQQAEADSEYAEMKAELDTYHNAQLSDANRRFRTMIIALTQRLDHFLSTQVSPSELLQDVEVRLEARAAGDGRLLAATFSVRCVETFSDLRRRFVHWMREEQGDAVLAFTPDSQFCVPGGQVNASCRTNVHDSYVKQQQPTHYEHSDHPEEERKQPPPSHSYSLTRPLAAFRARATRARAGYGLKQQSPSVEEETITAESGRLGNGDGSAGSSVGTMPSFSHPPSPRSLKGVSQHSNHSPLHDSSHQHSTTDTLPSASHSASSFTSASFSSAHSASQGNTHSTAPLPLVSSSLLIVDEEVAIINFLPDFVHSLSLRLLGAVVLVSDQAANTRHRRHSQPPIPSVHVKPSFVASASSATSSPPSTAFQRPFNRSSLYAFSTSASKLPARLLPHLRHHFPSVVGPPPLPKFPPSLSALFHRQTQGQPALRSTLSAVPSTAAQLSSMPLPAATPMPTGDRFAVSKPALSDSVSMASAIGGDAVGEQTDGPSLRVSGSVDSDESESSEDSVRHVSITHSQSQSSYLQHDDDDIEPDMLHNRASLPPPFPSRPPVISHYGRRRHHSHPLAAAAGGPYAGLTVDVEVSVSSRVDSVSVQPSQSFSVDLPYVDYIDYDLQEDSRLMEQSRTYSQQSELDRESSLMREYEPAYDEHEPDDDELLNTTGSSASGMDVNGGGGGGGGAGAGGGMNGVGGRRRRRAYPVDGSSGELSHSNSFSAFRSTPPSTQPTPSSISRPQSSATLDLLAAGVLLLPAQPSSLPASVSSPSSLPHSTFSSVSSPPYILPTSPPVASSFNPLLSNSPNEHSQFLSPNAHRVRSAPRNGVRRSS